MRRTLLNRSPLPAGATAAAFLLACSGGLHGADLLFEWTPIREAIAGQTLTAQKGPSGTLAQPAAFDADGLLIFDGKQDILFPEADAAQIPMERFSVEARVRIDRPQDWGGIIGYTQDNGSHERGWQLGFRNDQFYFKVADNGTLTGAMSGKSFTPGEWVHLLGVMEGKTTRLYVNGQEAASGAVEGKILPPEQPTPFALGSYKDANEHFPVTGRIAMVKISAGVPDAAYLEEIRKAEQEATFTVQPRIAFPDPATAVISWQAAPGDAILFYGSGPTLDQTLPLTSTDGRYKVTLDNLRPATEYKYRIGSGPSAKRLYSKIQSFDTRFNLSPTPVETLPETSPATLAYADEALRRAPDQSGYILVLGLTDGKLPAALASRSRFHVIAADRDPAAVAALRQTYYKAGLLGHRISVVHLDPAGPVPWTDSFADLIVSEHSHPPLDAAECARLVRPSGGTILLPATAAARAWHGASPTWTTDDTWSVLLRGKLEGARDWTHQYGTAGNASYTGEALGETGATSGLGVQWIGRPGGDFGIDRQPRMPAPLAANGRLFHQGLDRLVALNAFNGAVLWSYEVPALRRLNVAHDCSNWSADDDHLYLAIRDRLWMLDARFGELLYALPLSNNERGTHDWGYVANEGEVIIGSAVRADSTFRNFWGGEAWFDKVGTPGATTQVCSDRLFAYRKSDAKALWAYGRGLVINSTLSLHDGKLYFLENRTLKLPDDANGRVADRRLWLDLTTVCLDAATGKLLWEKPGPRPELVTGEIGFVQCAYGIATGHGFLAVLSEGRVDEKGAYLKDGKFLCSLFDHAGEVQWRETSPWLADHHGVHITHPVVTEERLYLAPEVHDIKTGRPLGLTYGPRRGCSTIVATKHSLMFRILGEGNSPLGLWNQETGSVSRFQRLRPSCWLNTLPAQGMLLVPEGGAGCSCGGWMETSVGFLPRATTPAAP